MKFLIRKQGEKVKAHYWDGFDTACRMASTGGLKMDRFVVMDSLNGNLICHMCRVKVDGLEASLEVCDPQRGLFGE